MESAIAVGGTLIGILVGVVGSYVVQRSGQRTEAQERLAATRREVYVDFLVVVHEMYAALRRAHQERRAGLIDEEELRLRLGAISPHQGQTKLEHLRLVSSVEAARSATNLWSRMRRDKAPWDPTITGTQLKSWESEYWKSRHALINVARSDMGLEPLRAEGEAD